MLVCRRVYFSKSQELNSPVLADISPDTEALWVHERSVDEVLQGAKGFSKVKLTTQRKHLLEEIGKLVFAFSK